MTACAACRENVDGGGVQIDLGVFHDECFVCATCLEPFPDGAFFSHKGRLYCEPDYVLQHGSRCRRCALPIVGRTVSALDAKWHAEHFVCESCARPLYNTKYSTRGNGHQAFCAACEKALREQEVRDMALQCTMCKKPARADEVIMVNEGADRVHAHHFTCQMCRSTLSAKDCRELDATWYCGPCFQKITTRVCASCRKPIVGRSVAALGKLWHPDHFSCAICEKSFQNEPYYEWSGRAYCIDHYNEARGQLCLRCGMPARGNAVTALRRQWCENHFLCTCCDAPLGGSSGSASGAVCNWDEKPMCARCYDALPLDLRMRLRNYVDLEKKHLATRSADAAGPPVPAAGASGPAGPARR